jgi:hypothetical protein
LGIRTAVAEGWASTDEGSNWAVSSNGSKVKIRTSLTGVILGGEEKNNVVTLLGVKVEFVLKRGLG